MVDAGFEADFNATVPPSRDGGLGNIDAKGHMGSLKRLFHSEWPSSVHEKVKYSLENVKDNKESYEHIGTQSTSKINWNEILVATKLDAALASRIKTVNGATRVTPRSKNGVKGPIRDLLMPKAGEWNVPVGRPEDMKKLKKECSSWILEQVLDALMTNKHTTLYNG